MTSAVPASRSGCAGAAHAHGPPRGPSSRDGDRGVVRALVLHPRHACEIGVDLAPGHAAAAVVALLLEEVVHPAARQDVLPQRHGPVLGDDHLGVAADGVQPVAELLGVRHGGRQGHQGHRLGEVNDHFLPDGTAEAVGEVVDLVHDHMAEAEQRLRARVQHVAQHLGGHHDHRRLGVDAVVTGEQADLVRAVAPGEVGVLLVGQCLDGCGVEAFTALLKGQVDGELADDGLAGAGGRRDEHALARFQGLTGLDLEGVQVEFVQRSEGGQRGGLLSSANTGSDVALSGREVLGHLAHEPTRHL